MARDAPSRRTRGVGATARRVLAAPLDSLALSRFSDDFVWLDSAVGDRDRGRRALVTLALESAVVVDSAAREASLCDADGVMSRVEARDVWRAADAMIRDESARFGAGLGWVGYVGYEAQHLADDALPAPNGPSPFPVLRFDRVRAAIVSQDGVQELRALGATVDEAEAIADTMLDRVNAAMEAASETPNPTGVAGAPHSEARLTRASGPTLSAEAHAAAVAQIREAIAAGDVYQACLTLPLWCRRPPALEPLYAALRARSPGDFGGYFRLGALEAASTSPERLLRVDGRKATCRPMKGTRRRDLDPEADARVAIALADSAKDRAENLMIVDLMRNDIGRVCEAGSVRAPTLCEVERYATVHQMTSTVTGTLLPDVGPFTALRAVFPPGSMTGAPKIAACHLLRQLEVAPRGLYAGALGWVGYDGVSEFSVVIRTLQAYDDVARWDVGGGIVWDSTAEAEWDEAMAKAAPIADALDE